MRKKVYKLWPTKIPLYWNRKGDKKHIGWFFPGEGAVTTVNGTKSIGFRKNLDNKTTDATNLAHDRRMIAAFYTEDFTFVDGMTIPEEDKKLVVAGGQ